VYADVRALGAELVAISPQNETQTMATATDLGLDYPVCSDRGNRLAAEFHLKYAFSDDMQRAYKSLGMDLAEYNDEEPWTLPVPATYIVNQDAVITAALVDADYTVRMEPEELVEHLKKLG